MVNDKTTSIERVIAKIDNDFNPDNNDWIPRVGVWCIEAMQQLKVLRKVYKTKKLKVINRIATDPCCLSNKQDNDLKVFDEDDCEVEEMSAGEKCVGCDSSTGDPEGEEGTDVSDNIGTIDPTNTVEFRLRNPYAEVYDSIAIHTNDKNPIHSKLVETVSSKAPQNKNFVIQGNHIELNYDAEYITIKYKDVDTEFSEHFNMDVPKLPNNGIFIEAVANYCMFKMLSRGYKHLVMSLTASSPALNPYLVWRELSEKAKRSVLLDDQANPNAELFRSNFYIYSYNPRH